VKRKKEKKIAPFIFLSFRLSTTSPKSFFPRWRRIEVVIANLITKRLKQLRSIAFILKAPRPANRFPHPPVYARLTIHLPDHLVWPIALSQAERTGKVADEQWLLLDR